jgi:hypothetical protein
VIKDH